MRLLVSGVAKNACVKVKAQSPSAALLGALLHPWEQANPFWCSFMRHAVET